MRTALKLCLAVAIVGAFTTGLGFMSLLATVLLMASNFVSIRDRWGAV